MNSPTYRSSSQICIEPIEGVFSLCKVTDYSGVDFNSPFTFIATTDEEKSLVCPSPSVPVNATDRDDGWKMMRITGVLDFSLVGILAGISSVLSENKIGIFAVSTYNTDYILTKVDCFKAALKALDDAGYCIVNK